MRRLLSRIFWVLLLSTLAVVLWCVCVFEAAFKIWENE